LLATVVVFVVALSAGLYNHVGSPDVRSAGVHSDELPDMDAVLESLQQRLANNPDDIKGWKMLARSQMMLQRFDDAVTTYERVMELEDGRNAQTLVDLALAVLSRDGSAIEGRTAALIESALTLEPNNPAALFYSGVASGGVVLFGRCVSKSWRHGSGGLALGDSAGPESAARDSLNHRAARSRVARCAGGIAANTRRPGHAVGRGHR
jgi:cytochrome c-type biogenesis protein CcmH